MINGISSQTPTAIGQNAQAAQAAPTTGSEQVGEVLQNIQAKYGVKPKPGREIKKTLDKDDFLKIMMMQMKHQDPTSPFKADEMAGRMAQFATLEQLQNVNTNIKGLGSQAKPAEQLAMTGMIGKTITIDRSRFPHMEGKGSESSFGLPKDAKDVKIAIVNDMGEVVHERDMGALKAGENVVNWDGMKNGSTIAAKSGTYTLRVEAVDENNSPIQIQSQAQGRVVGVSFQGTEPVFLVGDQNRQEKVAFRSVVQIDAIDVAPSVQAMPGQAPVGMPGVPAQAGLRSVGGAGGGPNFFSFTPGQGSQAIDIGKAPPEAAEALKGYQARPAEQAPKAEGFANGLDDKD